MSSPERKLDHKAVVSNPNDQNPEREPLGRDGFTEARMNPRISIEDRRKHANWDDR